jgi:hypothetical protein
MGELGLIRSPISVGGMVLTTISVVLFLIVFLADLFGLHTNPYIGIVVFLVLPVLFLLGLTLIPLGAWLERRRRAAGRPAARGQWPRIDFNDQTHRTAAVLVFALTLANIAIVSLAAYRGVEYMDSVGFCGQVCHAPMRPQFAAHGATAHARVRCVDCHVGSSASSSVATKLAGARRVLAFARGSYSRPIVASPDQLVAGVETCERCHSSETPRGNTVRRYYEYAEDEENTESVTTLQLHVGGGPAGTATGAHWHADEANRIEYAADDPGRQTIPYVRVTDRQGVVREYLADGADASRYANGGGIRRMDCADCHNRPGHAMDPTPERAVNEAMARGEMPATLPFVRREAVNALKVEYPSSDVALREIARTLEAFYQMAQPQVVADRRDDIEAAIRGTTAIYQRNVFPEMNVTFGTYPNNMGHLDAPGCFRCHDGGHRTSDGRTIGRECRLCHQIE